MVAMGKLFSCMQKLVSVNCDRDQLLYFIVLLQLVFLVFEDIYRRFKDLTPTTGAFLGSSKAHWSIKKILNEKKAFVYEFEKLLVKREPIFFKVFF